MRQLPKFKGYTVDVRLREFRKVVYAKEFETIAFTTPEGQRLLTESLNSLLPDSALYKEIKEIF